MHSNIVETFYMSQMKRFSTIMHTHFNQSLPWMNESELDDIVYIYNRVTARIQGFNISMKKIRTIICLNLNLHCWAESAWLHLWQHFKVLTTLFNPIFIQHCFSGFVFVHETWSARMSMHECKVRKGRMCSSKYV